MPLQRIGILGVGLLGGSVSLALRRRHPELEVHGLVRDRTKGQRYVDRGILDKATTSLPEACDQCDAVVVATPVDRLATLAIEAANHTPQHCLISDVGSTKAAIVRSIEAVPNAAAKFVAAHPIAGSEKSGADYATETLFDGKPVVITPGTACEASKLEQAETFWKDTGAVVCRMSPEDHDRHLAAISHVPHLISAVVARMLDPNVKSLIGSGWKDITRVAAGDPEMWTAICTANRDAILLELRRLSSEVEALQHLIQTEDHTSLLRWLDESRHAKLNAHSKS